MGMNKRLISKETLKYNLESETRLYDYLNRKSDIVIFRDPESGKVYEIFKSRSYKDLADLLIQAQEILS